MMWLSSNDWTVSKCQPTQDSNTQNNADISIPGVGFEPVVPVFERPKTLWVLGRAATMVGLQRKERQTDTKDFENSVRKYKIRIRGMDCGREDRN